MKKYIIVLAVFRLFFLGAWESYSRGNKEVQFPKIKPRGPVKTFGFKTIQEVTKNYNPALFPEVLKYVSGTANANANTATGEIWGVAIDDGLAPDDWYNIGFKSNGLKNTGTSDWEKITVSVTVIISAVTVDNITDIFVDPCVGDQEVLNSYAMFSVEKPGTYTVTSRAFNMKPNLDYYALVVARGRGAKNKPGGLAGKFVSIKFVF